VGSATGIHDDAGLTSQVVEAEEGYVERSARAFAESDLVFSRGFSNAPFLPVALLGSTHYGDANISEEGATPETAGNAIRSVPPVSMAECHFCSISAAWW